MSDASSLLVFRAGHYLAEQPKAYPAELAPDQGLTAYLRRREQAERAAAKNARSAVSRRVHQELAQAYAARLVRLGSAVAAEVDIVIRPPAG